MFTKEEMARLGFLFGAIVVLSVMATIGFATERSGCGEIFTLVNGQSVTLGDDFEITWETNLPHYYKAEGFRWGDLDGWGISYPLMPGETMLYGQNGEKITRLSTLNNQYKFCIKKGDEK